MSGLNLQRIANQASPAIPAESTVTFEIPEHAGGALHVTVDGPYAAASICLWRSGICEFTTASSETGGTTIQEHHFSTEHEAIEGLVAHILRAQSFTSVRRA